MRVPRKVICELEGSGDSFTFMVDKYGWCHCGESIVNDDGEICALATEVLEWQDIQPAYLKGGIWGREMEADESK